MSDNQARIGSIDALEAFRGDLLRYLERAREALDEATGEVRRTRGWLDVDRRVHWEGEARKRAKRLAQAEQELYSASLATLKESNAPLKLEVLKARRLLEEAEQKLRVLKQWRQNFDNRAGFLLRQLDPMEFKVRQDLPTAVVFLTEALKALQDYAQTRRVPRGTGVVAEAGVVADGAAGTAAAAEAAGEGTP
jgi:hypothetical protein